jgi:uncharacterized protein (DUF952 family)
MTEDEIKKIITVTVSETLLKMGVYTDDPIEAQKDFMHLRSWRQSTEAVKRQSMLAAIGVVTAGMLALIWGIIRN